MTDPRRFALLLAPALVAASLLLASASESPVMTVAAARHPLKVTAGSFLAQGALVTPAPGGGLIVRLRQMTVRDLCASMRVGPRVLRFDVPRFDAADLTAEVDGLDGLGVLGQRLPLPGAGGPGVPLRLGTTALQVDVTPRTLAGRGWRLARIGMTTGAARAECF